MQVTNVQNKKQVMALVHVSCHFAIFGKPLKCLFRHFSIYLQYSSINNDMFSKQYLTSFKSLRRYGLQFFLHHSSTWPLKCILSITMLTSESFDAAEVNFALAGFLAYLCR